jgi:hypothetical protein
LRIATSGRRGFAEHAGHLLEWPPGRSGCHENDFLPRAKAKVRREAKCLQRAGKWPAVSIYLTAIVLLNLDFASP